MRQVLHSVTWRKHPLPPKQYRVISAGIALCSVLAASKHQEEVPTPTREGEGVGAGKVTKARSGRTFYANLKSFQLIL